MNMLTLERFRELCKEAGLTVPLKVDASPELLSALARASEGDFSLFDGINAKLAKHDQTAKDAAEACFHLCQASKANVPIGRRFEATKEVFMPAIQRACVAFAAEEEARHMAFIARIAEQDRLNDGLLKQIQAHRDELAHQLDQITARCQHIIRRVREGDLTPLAVGEAIADAEERIPEIIQLLGERAQAMAIPR